MRRRRNQCSRVLRQRGSARGRETTTRSGPVVLHTGTPLTIEDTRVRVREPLSPAHRARDVVVLDELLPEDARKLDEVPLRS
ncbi:hypothetical protein [Streptomyces reniochalinae]|uniref:Uncharacterized protein n=1 Tax=Streptomyces reniochalinae TaxID=2250578 RepID=A0A367EEJ9_9ACTN|nr:hypothetical protein [Streptomyces reniochalinae]RCG16162.1 hypothetical protein DQ392_21795 [Streptomyces reniochalinae]